MRAEETIRLELPWPARELNPNIRVHWARKAGAAKQYKAWAFCAARAAGIRPTFRGKPRLVWTFYPLDRRRRDVDNVIASLKAAQDGIAQAMGLDDSVFACRWPEVFSEPVTGGAVVVEVIE